LEPEGKEAKQLEAEVMAGGVEEGEISFVGGEEGRERLLGGVRRWGELAEVEGSGVDVSLERKKVSRRYSLKSPLWMLRALLALDSMGGSSGGQPGERKDRTYTLVLRV
jgi:hypothetical protein